MMSDLLTGPSYSLHSKAKKLIVMLHGYGDTAENFIYIANQLDQEEWGAQYISLNAPETIPNYPMGNQWFDIYPNGVPYNMAGEKENKIMENECKISTKKIESYILNLYYDDHHKEIYQVLLNYSENYFLKLLPLNLPYYK